MVWITALPATEIRCDTKFRFIPCSEPSSGREREVKQIEARAESIVFLLILGSAKPAEQNNKCDEAQQPHRTPNPFGVRSR
jgi:hypothetical protein